MACEQLVQLIQNDAGLDDCRFVVRVNFYQPVQKSAVINNQRLTHRLTALGGTAAAGQNGYPLFRRDLNCAGDIIPAARNQHPDRLNLIDGGIGRVPAPRKRVEQHIAFDLSAKTLS